MVRSAVSESREEKKCCTSTGANRQAEVVKDRLPTLRHVVQVHQQCSTPLDAVNRRSAWMESILMRTIMLSMFIPHHLQCFKIKHSRWQLLSRFFASSRGPTTPRQQHLHLIAHLV